MRAEGRGRVLDPAAEAAHDEAAHDEAAHDEAAHDEAAHDEAAHAIALLRVRYPQQRAVGAVLAVDVTRWSGWEATPAG